MMRMRQTRFSCAAVSVPVSSREPPSIMHTVTVQFWAQFHVQFPPPYIGSTSSVVPAEMARPIRCNAWRAHAVPSALARLRRAPVASVGNVVGESVGESVAGEGVGENVPHVPK